VTPEIAALKEMKATLDPTIPYNFAQQKEDFNNSYVNPLGAYTTPAVRDAAVRANNERMNVAQSQAVQGSQYNADNTNYGRTAGVAAMTAPQLVQTGGTQTQTQSGGLLGQILGGVAQVGASYAGGLGSAKNKA
jgi:hypothetical protein